MCELILSDIWKFLCNFPDEKWQEKLIRKPAAKEIEPDFSFRTENQISIDISIP